MRKKLFDIPFFSGLMIPVAIVLFGAAIIFGITRLLSNDRSYKDLVQELQTKTFGNRWVAAFELSKHLASSSIPPEDIPWLVENLTAVYNQAPDERTRTFIIMALGTLNSPLAAPLFARSLQDPDPKIHFHTLVALGNMPKGYPFDWPLLIPFLRSPDPGLRQVTILTLATHQILMAKGELDLLLKDNNSKVRFAAATGLIYFRDEQAIPVLNDILHFPAVPETKTGFDAQQVGQLKLNVINALGKMNWPVLNPSLERLAAYDQNLEVATKAKEILKILKN